MNNNTPSSQVFNGFIILFFLFFSSDSYSQKFNPEKNSLYVYWGWNISGYTNSDIAFNSDDYNFTLYDVVAKDRQSEFSLKQYFGPGQFTIPQYNFRIGYLFRENWNISFGIDHMKYVAQQGQKVIIDGNIVSTGTDFDGEYNEEEIAIEKGFLEFEHTDGLNYGQFTLQHQSPLLDHKVIQISWLQGFGIGTYTPRSEIKLLKYEESDLFHLAGFGFDGMLGLKIGFFNHFFIQGELKGGYVNLPRIITGPDRQQRANQQFWFLQQNVVFGSSFSFKKKGRKETLGLSTSVF